MTCVVTDAQYLAPICIGNHAIVSTGNSKHHEFCLLLTGQNYTPQRKTFEALHLALSKDNSQFQHHILFLN